MADEYDPTSAAAYDIADEGYTSNQYNSTEQQDSPDEDDDYDPSSVDVIGTPAQNEPIAAPPSLPPAQKPTSAIRPPQKIAGFLVEDSDEEPEEPAPNHLANADGIAAAKPDAHTVVEEQTQDTLLHSAPQDTAPVSTSLNGSTSVPIPPVSTSTPIPPTPTAAVASPSLSSALHVSPSDQGKAISPIPSAVPTLQPPINGAAAILPVPSATPAAKASIIAPPARLPHDIVGQLEDRIKEDPRGDTSAWLSLIDHYHNKGQHDFTRAVFARFFDVFPTAVSMRVKQIQYENELDETNRVVAIFNSSLMQTPNVDIWKLYLDHVRRALPLMNDPNGQNRSQIVSAFDVTLDNVGIDPDSGILWRDYIDFLKDGPGTVGGSSWQDLQKVDLLRKVYQRAIKLPHSENVRLWKEYEVFEMSLHKATGRRHIQEQSPHYMQCRTAKMQLDSKLEGLDRSSLPRMPPLYGCLGDDEFEEQVVKWRSWIAWERDEDPLVYKGSEDEAWRKRVLYAYNQATMFLYFYPPIWFEAASWCFTQAADGMVKEGEKFLDKGIIANPESVLLAMMKVDRVESSLESGNTPEVLIRNGDKLDAPFENLHTALYALRTKQTDKDKIATAQIRERYAALPPEETTAAVQDGDDEDADSGDEAPKSRQEQEAAEIEAVKAMSAPHLEALKKVISYVWVAKLQAFRRVQGQGKAAKKGEELKANHVKGFRGIFSECRPRGSLSSEVYVAAALLEWICYRDMAANRIFERGLKLFPDDEGFILEYIKHLISQNDVTNARVVFESSIPKILNNAKLPLEQKRQKCRPLLGYMHEYESKYGDLAQIHKLEKRMAELYPDEPEITRFSHRYELPNNDAIETQLILSPAQALPKPVLAGFDSQNLPTQAVTSIETALSSPKVPDILLGPNGPYLASPKRPLDDLDDGPSRKFLRAESPLKGAAGLRIASNKAAAANASGHASSGSIGGGGGAYSTKTFVPSGLAAQQGGAASLPPMPLAMPLPPQVDAMLRIMPKASAYTAMRLDGAKLVQFMPGVNVEHAWALHHAGQLQRR